MQDNIFAIRNKKNSFIEPKKNTHSKKITQAALGLLGTFSMSAWNDRVTSGSLGLALLVYYIITTSICYLNFFK